MIKNLVFIVLTLIFVSRDYSQQIFHQSHLRINVTDVYNKIDITKFSPYKSNPKEDTLLGFNSNNKILNYPTQEKNLNFLNLFNKTDSLSIEGNPDPCRFAIASGGLLGLFVGFHFYQMNAWWKNERGPFHVLDDPSYALKIDKVGHFYGGMLGSVIGKSLADWVGYEHRTSVWIGAAIGSLWELYIEFEDGFGKNWGFSPSDATADVIGAFYPVAQEYWDPLKAFNLKFSYIPSNQLNKTSTAGNKKIIFDDYEGHTYWLTMNIFDLLSESDKKKIPDYLQWLQLAVGYGLRNYDGEEESVGRHVTDKELYIALDYSFEKLLNIDTKFFRSLKESPVVRTIAKVFDFFHFPSPAIRFTFPGALSKSPSKPIIYGFYFSN